MDGTHVAVIGRGVLPHGFRLHAAGETDFVFQEVTLDPGASTGWHSHPGPLLVVVRSGMPDARGKGPDDPKVRSRRGIHRATRYRQRALRMQPRRRAGETGGLVHRAVRRTSSRGTHVQRMTRELR